MSAGDIIFVPAGTVHAIGAGVMLYELQEYSDITYRLYDYGRLTASGTPRELHIERSLDVSRYEASPRIKVKPVALPGGPAYEDRCLVACSYEYAILISAASLHARPKNESPTGRPKMNPMGTLMLGYPATAGRLELLPAE